MAVNRSTKRKLGIGLILMGILIALFLVYLLTPPGREQFAGAQASIFGWLLPVILIYTGLRWVR